MPHNMRIFMSWRTHIPELIQQGSFRTQGELVSALLERGFTVTQATVSRELAALGVIKVDGCYRLPVLPAAGAYIRRWRVTAHDCLMVIGTEPAFAMVLAQAIDEAELERVLGTVAGDDTVFVATDGASGTAQLMAWLGLGGDDAEPSPARHTTTPPSGPASGYSKTRAR